MSKFKTGDEVKAISTSFGWGAVEAGDIGVVKVALGIELRVDFADHKDWSCYEKDLELVKPKWSIYNNTLPWSQLSDKQKGKLLVADNNGLIFNGLTFNNRPQFIYYNAVYTVTKPEPVKPEPTMAEMFVSDWSEQKSIYKKDVADYMIAKGWSKS
jgi:hypothetical protein